MLFSSHSEAAADDDEPPFVTQVQIISCKDCSMHEEKLPQLLAFLDEIDQVYSNVVVSRIGKFEPKAYFFSNQQREMKELRHDLSLEVRCRPPARRLSIAYPGLLLLLWMPVVLLHDVGENNIHHLARALLHRIGPVWSSLSSWPPRTCTLSCPSRSSAGAQPTSTASFKSSIASSDDDRLT
jgi:hypothetical protein